MVYGLRDACHRVFVLTAREGVCYNVFQKFFDSENVAPFKLISQAARAQVFLKYVVY